MTKIILIILIVKLLDVSQAQLDDDISGNITEAIEDINTEVEDDEPSKEFDGVYQDCVFQFSYSCIQNRTLNYLMKLNDMKEVKLIGDYIKFVKLEEDIPATNKTSTSDANVDLGSKIDKAVNRFFDDHILRFNPTGKDSPESNAVEEFVGRKKRKGGGGGGGDDGGGHDHKKKMMMMAMMCMKMKMLMMVPAMMGMMSMMSFKGMMFSMMSFMIAKLMLLMKILEKKNGGGGSGGGGSGGGDGWMSGGGGGAWMPAGSSDGYGGPGGGYNAAGEWQNGRSMIIQDNLSGEQIENQQEKNLPHISYVTPAMRTNKKIYSSKKNKAMKYKTIVDYDELEIAQPPKSNQVLKNRMKRHTTIQTPKSRSKRGIIDFLSYFSTYMSNRLYNFYMSNFGGPYPRYTTYNGVRYIYTPYSSAPQKMKYPTIFSVNPDNHNVAVKGAIKVASSPIVAAESTKDDTISASQERMMDSDSLKQLAEINEELDQDPWQ